MSPDDALDMYRRQLAENGEDITVRRYAGTGAARGVAQQAVARGRPLGTAAQRLVGATVQQGRKVILINDPAAPVAAGNVALADLLPLTTDDKLFFRGRELSIGDVDDDTRRVAGVLIAMDIMVAG